LINSNSTLDFTDRFTRPDNHQACNGGSLRDVYKCKYHSDSGLKDVAVKALQFIQTKLEEDKETGVCSWLNKSSKSGGGFVTRTSSCPVLGHCHWLFPVCLCLFSVFVNGTWDY
ncbi:hypothetical protein PAXRUDRAFT_176865, partial [Paxillus rubicundulus Ve08.2h10]